MAHNKGSSGGSHHSLRGRPYALILLITFGVALLGVMVLHKLRERRIYTLLIKEKDNQILALQLLLQKERDRSKELREKNEGMKGKIYTLRNQKMALARTVGEMRSTLDSLKDEQKLMESAVEEQQKELRLMQEQGSNVGQEVSEIVALRETIKHKEAEIEDLKRRLGVTVNDHPTIFPETVTANGTMTAQDEIEKDENSGDSYKYNGNGKVGSEIKDEIRTNGEQGKANEDPQDDGRGAAKNVDDAEMVDEREKKIGEEHAGLDNNTDGGGQVKQLVGMKRKHGHARRTKGKRWRTIVKSSSMENNGGSDNHIGNRKGNRDNLKGKTVGRDSGEENFAREDEVRDNNSPRTDKSHAKLLKSENQESKEANGLKVNNINQQLSYSGTNTETLRLDEMRQSEENEQSLDQQNWSKRHINIVDKNAGQTKSKMSLEGPEELEEALGVQKQDKGAMDSAHDEEYFSKESQSDFEDEKDEYKEEMDESEFQLGL